MWVEGGDGGGERGDLGVGESANARRADRGDLGAVEGLNVRRGQTLDRGGRKGRNLRGGKIGDRHSPILAGGRPHSAPEQCNDALLRKRPTVATPRLHLGNHISFPTPFNETRGRRPTLFRPSRSRLAPNGAEG